MFSAIRLPPPSLFISLPSSFSSSSHGCTFSRIPGISLISETKSGISIFTLTVSCQRTDRIQNPSAQDQNLYDDDDSPVSVELAPIISEGQFDRIIAETEDAVVIIWMATWCRRCVYLKPKMEKLAADYFPRIRFYCVDVNAVPHKLVARANVTKMPTVQVWMENKKQGEVIGGHKAYLVVNEVHEIIENTCFP